MPTRTATIRTSTRRESRSSRRAEIILLEPGAELGHELADAAGDGRGGPDRLGEGPTDGDGLGRPDRLDRLGAHAGGLVEPAADGPVNVGGDGLPAGGKATAGST